MLYVSTIDVNVERPVTQDAEVDINSVSIKLTSTPSFLENGNDKRSVPKSIVIKNDKMISIYGDICIFFDFLIFIYITFIKLYTHLMPEYIIFHH